MIEIQPMIVVAVAIAFLSIVGLACAFSSKKNGQQQTENFSTRTIATTPATTTTTTPILHPTTYLPFTMIERIEVSHNTRIFRFQLPENTSLGLPIGKHVSLRAQTIYNPKPIFRSYTPITDEDDKGYFDLLIKVYPLGTMSRHLDDLSVGESVQMAGPKGKFEYTQGGYDFIGMIAGGTGITPMYQIIKSILKNKNDPTRVALIYANVAEDDILLRPELEAYQKDDARFSVFYTLDKPSEVWNFGKGFVTKDMIEQHIGIPATRKIILCCGPPPMMDFMKKNLDALEYKEQDRFIF